MIESEGAVHAATKIILFFLAAVQIFGERANERMK
jgi:hypothetical protein